jgi:hypothetical protein
MLDKALLVRQVQFMGMALVCQEKTGRMMMITACSPCYFLIWYDCRLTDRFRRMNMKKGLAVYRMLTKTWPENRIVV